jgi:hypothetical protein
MSSVCGITEEQACADIDASISYRVVRKPDARLSRVHSTRGRAFCSVRPPYPRGYQTASRPASAARPTCDHPLLVSVPATRTPARCSYAHPAALRRSFKKTPKPKSRRRPRALSRLVSRPHHQDRCSDGGGLVTSAQRTPRVLQTGAPTWVIPAASRGENQSSQALAFTRVDAAASRGETSRLRLSHPRGYDRFIPATPTHVGTESIPTYPRGYSIDCPTESVRLPSR